MCWTYQKIKVMTTIRTLSNKFDSVNDPYLLVVDDLGCKVRVHLAYHSLYLNARSYWRKLSQGFQNLKDLLEMSSFLYLWEYNKSDMLIINDNHYKMVYKISMHSNNSDELQFNLIHSALMNFTWFSLPDWQRIICFG